MMPTASPHRGQPIHTAGLPLAEAQSAMIMLHGRGASAEDILSLVPHLNMAGFIYLAPQAAGNTWYPQSFLAPITSNEPWLSSALALVGELLQQVQAGGVATNRVMLLGFSQGACLAAEFAARNAQPYGGVIGFSGGLIGPDGTPRDYTGSLDGTPVFLGCSDIDPHIPAARVHESAAVFSRMGAAVDKRLYASMGHTIIQDEIDAARAIMSGLADP